MGLPNYLAKIKSAGMYRFTFDKSQIPAVAAETMRLVVGYSDKGPFNNPVYIDNKQDFINLFGNVNKRLEKKGVFFHRMALQALSAGPILALNLKHFGEPTDGADGETVENVKYISIDPSDIVEYDASMLPDFAGVDTKSLTVRDLYDRSRFWKLDADLLPSKIEKIAPSTGQYISITATDTKATSCSLFIRKSDVSSLKQYNITVAEWYKSVGEEIPEYLENHTNNTIDEFFADVYVFRGRFTDALTVGDAAPLKNYFEGNDASCKYLKASYKNTFNEVIDTLDALSADENSNFIGLYRGCLLPYFKDANGQYVSLDIMFNADKDTHKMLMKLNDDIIDGMLEADEDVAVCKLLDWNSGLKQLVPIYLEGYTYGTVDRKSPANVILDNSMKVLAERGIYEALTNHVESEYHYIIDTFASLSLTNNVFGKGNICEIAKKKDNCLAIMNFPSVADIRSNNSYSNYAPTSLDNYNWMPSEVNGASYCAFYTPLVFGDGTVKTTVPSAAIVSNNFMEKWNSRQPYYIVAGPNYGRMEYEGLVGPDYNYSRADLDVYEPYGVNAMVYVPRKGTYINSNQTAKQRPVSALSKVHVRELVIFLQNEIENMMQNYQWELNTQTLRDAIKTKADAILEKIKNNGGVYAYINVCDGTNNTPDVIDNEMVILDTSIEPARGAGKMVQRLTIHKTGGISALTM